MFLLLSSEIMEGFEDDSEINLSCAPAFFKSQFQVQ